MRYLLVFVFFFSLFSLTGQQIDKTYYLLGTMLDYVGREDNSQIIVLHQNCIGQIQRIEEISALKFKRLPQRKGCSNCQEFLYLKSARLSNEINAYYTFDKKKPSQYCGKLNCEKICAATKIQKLSFVSGLFLTTGDKDGQYRISLFNSPERFECLKQILKDLNAEILDEKITEGLPWSYVINFNPNPELKGYLDTELNKKALDKTK